MIEETVKYCRHGHPYDADNTYYSPKGQRACRACARKSARAHQDRLRADGVSIYVLCDPRTDEVRYVGRTAYPATRLSRHLATCGTFLYDHTPLSKWIEELHDAKLKPVLRVIEKVKKEDAPARERHYILHYHTQGCALVNTHYVHEKRKSLYAFLKMPEELQRRLEALAEERRCKVREVIISLLAESLAKPPYT